MPISTGVKQNDRWKYGSARTRPTSRSSPLVMGLTGGLFAQVGSDASSSLMWSLAARHSLAWRRRSTFWASMGCVDMKTMYSPSGGRPTRKTCSSPGGRLGAVWACFLLVLVLGAIAFLLPRYEPSTAPETLDEGHLTG